MGLKTDAELHSITQDLVGKLLRTDGIKIVKIILYGSYARGEAVEDSDIDIMVLCDNNEADIDKCRFAINSIGNRLSLENDLDVSIKVKDNQTFADWNEVVPFYHNVSTEGIILYG